MELPRPRCCLRVVTDNGAAFKSDAFVSGQPYLEHIRIRHYASNTNGVVERFRRSLKHEHLCQRQIANAAELADEVVAYLELFNEVRPHESLGQRQPLLVYCQDPHRFGG